MILVTGGAGYIGSHCVLELLRNGRNVVIFDSLEIGHLEIVETLKSQNLKGKIIDFVKGDLKNISDVRKLFEKYSFSAVVHFAAYSQVAESVTNPQKYYKNNVCGTLNLLNTMLEHNVKKIVFSSTAATYGNPVYTPIDENHPQIPINPYGETKLAIEKIMDEYSKLYELKSVRLRYFNVAGADETSIIGEWHNPETHLIPNILKSVFDKTKTFSIFGTDYKTKDGTCVRDYINITDLINAHLLALNYLFNGGDTNYFNLGTSEGSSVKEVFSVCENIINKKIPVEIKGRRDGDPDILIADYSKAKNILGWQPKRNLSQSVKTAYDWEKILTKKQSN